MTDKQLVKMGFVKMQNGLFCYEGYYHEIYVCWKDHTVVSDEDWLNIDKSTTIMNIIDYVHECSWETAR